jgi:hypothetical protein
VSPDRDDDVRVVDDEVQLEIADVDASRAEREIRVEIGPTYALEFDPPAGLQPNDFECALALPDRSERVTTHVRRRADSTEWVRFPSAPRTSLLGASGRSAYVLELASRDGFWRGNATVVASDGVSRSPVRFTLEPSARIEGRVQSIDGSAIAGARVKLDRARSARVRETRSDADGRWTLGAIAPGAWRIAVRSPAWNDNEQDVTLAPLETRVCDVRLVARATSSVAGELTSRSGTHVPRGVMRLRSTSDPDLVLDTATTPGTAGATRHDTFRFDAVPAGEYELLPPMDDAYAWDPPSQVGNVPGTFLPFVCRDDVTSLDIALRAVDGASGRPIERFRAAILLDRYDVGRRKALALEPRVMSIKARGGEAVLVGVPRDMNGWWLVECDGRASAWGALCDLRRTSTRRETTARLDPAWTCRMWIGTIDSRGNARPLEGAHVRTSGGQVLATSLADGSALIDLLYDPGRITIELADHELTSIEGFVRGKRRTALEVHRAWMERSR